MRHNQGGESGAQRPRGPIDAARLNGGSKSENAKACQNQGAEHALRRKCVEKNVMRRLVIEIGELPRKRHGLERRELGGEGLGTCAHEPMRESKAYGIAP